MQWASQLHLEGVTHIIWANQKTSQSEVLYFCETFIYLLLFGFADMTLEGGV